MTSRNFEQFFTPLQPSAHFFNIKTIVLSSQKLCRSRLPKSVTLLMDDPLPKSQ